MATRQDSERVGTRPESLAGRVEISGAHTRRAFSTALMKHFVERSRRWNSGLIFSHFVPASRQKQERRWASLPSGLTAYIALH